MSTDYELLSNEKKLKKELVFASLFIMTYENFVSSWEETILSFFANQTEFIDDKVVYSFTKPVFNGTQDWLPDKEEEKRYRDRVYHRIKKKDNNWDYELSFFDFMKEFGLIDEKDYANLERIRKIRNDYSHEMTKVLFSEPIQDARALFDELIKIRKKSNEFWIREVEIPISADDRLLDENGVFQSPEWVASMQDIFFDVIITNAMKDNEEANE